MDRLLAASLSTAGLGLVVLGVLAHVGTPEPVPLSRLAEREGQWVCIEARLVEARLLESGSTRFLLSDGERTIAGWARFPLPAAPGDQVRTCGSLARQAGLLEVVPRSPRDVRVLEAARDREIPFDALVRAPWEYVDQYVVTRALVDRSGASIFLHDPHAGGRVRATLDPDVAEGGPYRIEGLLEYVAEIASFRLRAETVVPLLGANE